MKHDKALLEEALRLEAIIQFPAPFIDVELVQEVGKADERVHKLG